MFSNLERCQSINRGMEVAHVHASLMSPSAVNMSVPVGGSTPFNGSAYHLSVNTVPKVRRCFYPRKGVQGDSAQRPVVQHLCFNCQIFECLVCARDCFQFWGCSSEQNRHPPKFPALRSLHSLGVGSTPFFGGGKGALGGLFAILDREVREGVTKKEAGTNCLRREESEPRGSLGRRLQKSKQHMQTPQVGTHVVCWQHQMKADVPAKWTWGKASEIR